MATLYLVSTPIGNLSDITMRATETLAAVSRVLAEDTRRTRILLDHLALATPLTSLHAHNETARTERVVQWLNEGADLALVTDAGTPLISDPGARLVRSVLDAGHDVVPIPGPSAPIAALVASGLPAERFTFLGFLPRKGRERTALLERISTAEETIVLFESPERLGALLEALEATCGPAREVAVAREITKLHEHFLRGTLEEARAYYQDVPPRGEVTVVIAPGKPAEGDPAGVAVDEGAARALGQALLDEGARPSQAAREVARRLDIPRNLAYRIIQSISG
ncbi:MAG: 16S rRNA (cytidine(1402)-2'-O)-methyltransferase [Gemmatimonadota bacterium]